MIGLAVSLEGRPGSSALFVLAVVVATYAGGVLSGVIASVLSYLALDYFFLEPLHSLAIEANSAAPLCVFLATVVVIASLLRRQQQAAARLRRLAADERDARRRSEFLETLAGRLARTTTPVDAAEAAISMLASVGIPMAAICVQGERTIEVLAVGGAAGAEAEAYREYACGRTTTPAARVLRRERRLEIRHGVDLDVRDPDGAVLRRQLQIESSAALPLPARRARSPGCSASARRRRTGPTKRPDPCCCRSRVSAGLRSSGCGSSSWSTRRRSVSSRLSFR